MRKKNCQNRRAECNLNYSFGMVRRVMLLTLLGLSSLIVSPVASQEPGWDGTVVARGQQRVKIESTEITRRPYRPLHFFGNTVRRRHYRGNVIPLPRDFYRGLRAFLER